MVRMAEWSKAPDSRWKPCSPIWSKTNEWDFWSSIEGMGSNPIPDMNFCSPYSNGLPFNFKPFFFLFSILLQLWWQKYMSNANAQLTRLPLRNVNRISKIWLYFEIFWIFLATFFDTFFTLTFLPYYLMLSSIFNVFFRILCPLPYLTSSSIYYVRIHILVQQGV